MIETDRQCTKCKTVFKVSPLNIKQRLCTTSTGDTVQVTFCECEECGNVNVLQLDDESTMNDLRKLTTLISRRIKTKGRGRNAEADRALKDKLNERMDSRRKALLDQNKGKDFYERNGKILIKSLDT